MQNTRILTLCKTEKTSKAVIYVMSRDQRVQDNHALIAAQLSAIEQSVPLYVFFNLKKSKSRSREHYHFMLAGLKEVARDLSALTIPFIMREGDSAANIVALADELESHHLYFDFNPCLARGHWLKKWSLSLMARSWWSIPTILFQPGWPAASKNLPHTPCVAKCINILKTT